MSSAEKAMKVTPKEAMEEQSKEEMENPSKPLTTGKFLCKREHWLPELFRCGTFNLSILAGLETPVVIPKLKCSRLSRMDEMFDNFDSELADKTQDLPTNDQDPIPTSEDIGNIFNDFKQGGKLEWPLNLQGNERSHLAETIPNITYSTEPQPRKTKLPYEVELQLAVSSLLSAEEKRPKEQTKSFKTSHQQTQLNTEDEELDYTKQEEDDAVEFLASKNYKFPTLKAISKFEKNIALARKEESLEVLYEKFKFKFLRDMETMQVNLEDEEEDDERDVTQYTDVQEENMKEVKEGEKDEEEEEETENSVEGGKAFILSNESEPDMEQTLGNQVSDDIEKSDQYSDEDMNDPDEALDILVKNDILQQALESISINDEDQMPENTNTETNKVEIETQLDKSENEKAIEQWLLKCSQDISQNLQIQFDMHNNALAVSEIEQIDYEAQITQINEMPLPNLQTVIQKVDEAKIPDKNQNQWLNSYMQRLNNFNEVMDQNMTEFRDPEAKRFRSSRIGDSASKTNLNDFKRTLLMPALPSFQDPRLQQLRILRPPTQRNAERANLQVDMAYVKGYATLRLDSHLNMLQLASKLGIAVYTADIQVLQLRFDDALFAWIWHDGSILIINARSKAILAETQKQLVRKIIGDKPSATLAQRNASHSQMVHRTEFPFGICIEEFRKMKTYPLAIDTTEVSNKFAYFVDKSIPGVAAKVSEHGVIQVFAINSDQADNMLKKLYLLTAKHRKPKIKTLEETKLF